MIETERALGSTSVSKGHRSPIYRQTHTQEGRESQGSGHFISYYYRAPNAGFLFRCEFGGTWRIHNS